MTAVLADDGFSETPLRVLLLEDSRIDADLLRATLLGAYPRATLEVVSDEDSFIERVVAADLDLILSDYRLPGFTGAEALRHARAARPDTPFIFVSGVIGEDNAVEMLKQGATDYVSKGRLARLPSVIARALREVTERRARTRAEARLHEADTLFERVVDSLRDHAVILLDTEGAIKTWNRAAHAVFGYSPPGPIGALVSTLHTAEERAAGVWKTMLQTALEQGRASHNGFLTRSDGSQFWAEGEIAPIYDDAGVHSGFSKIVRDTTATHRNAEGLRAAKESAEQANQAKDLFLAVLSHELRTPLAPIAAAVHLLERESAVPTKLQGLLPMIRRNVALEARLIDDLLDLTSISSGKITLNPEVVDMHQLLDDVIGMSRQDIDAKNLYLALDLRAENSRVLADPVRMQQVLWNVVRNAVKFTPEGGSIHLETESKDGAFIMRCVDSGIGIERQALPRIFTAFEQADTEVSKRFGGLGLGLAIAAGLVLQHAGRLTATSDGRGRGATFTLTLDTVFEDAAIAASAAVGTGAAGADGTAVDRAAVRAANAFRVTAALTPPATDVPLANDPPLRLLLVEDNVDAAYAMVMSLESFGYRVSHVLTLAAALASIAAHRFDVVVSDLGLPDGNGLEVGRALHGTTPVIALSGYGTARDVMQSTGAGFAAHLIKPADPDLVHATIQRTLAAFARPAAA